MRQAHIGGDKLFVDYAGDTVPVITLYGPAARVREGVEQWRAGITTPVLVPLSPDGNQMNGLRAVFAAFER
jgi:hypothetical protein